MKELRYISKKGAQLPKKKDAWKYFFAMLRYVMLCYAGMNPNPSMSMSMSSGNVLRYRFDGRVAGASLVMVTPPLPFEMPGKFQVAEPGSLPDPDPDPVAVPLSPALPAPDPLALPPPDPPLVDAAPVPYSTTPRQKSPMGQQATSPASSKAQCWAVVQHQLGSPMEEHDSVLVGQLGGMAGEKGTVPGPC